MSKNLEEKFDEFEDEILEEERLEEKIIEEDILEDEILEEEIIEDEILKEEILEEDIIEDEMLEEKTKKNEKINKENETDKVSFFWEIIGYILPLAFILIILLWNKKPARARKILYGSLSLITFIIAFNIIYHKVLIPISIKFNF